MSTLIDHRRLIQRQNRSGGARWWPVLLIVGGYLLFSHGCHGDEDNELFGSSSRHAPRAGYSLRTTTPKGLPPYLASSVVNWNAQMRLVRGSKSM
jgi:hypothetical protein